MAITHVDGVRGFELGPHGAVVDADAGLLVVRPGEPAVRLAARPDALVVGADGAIVAAVSGIVARFGQGGLGVEWPALDTSVRALALADDGRIAVGTDDERAWIGARDGAWIGDVELLVAPSDGTALVCSFDARA